MSLQKYWKPSLLITKYNIFKVLPNSIQGQTSAGGEEGQESRGEATTAEAKVKDKAAALEDEKKKRPLLPKSAIMRLLAELVRSYPSCAVMVTQHHFTSGQTELVAEDCNVLAFILDHLLPLSQDSGDKDCPALARVLLAALATCNHSPEAQATLVAEVKGALQRALAMLEGSDKHAKIQALTSIISTIIEACPSPGQIPNQVFKVNLTKKNS